MNEILLPSFGFREEVGLLETSFRKRVTSLTSAALEAALMADGREKRRSPGTAVNVCGSIDGLLMLFIENI